MRQEFALSASLLRQIRPLDLRTYLLTLGFTKVPDIDGNIAVYRKEDHELIVPQHLTLADYTNRIADIVLELANITGRKSNQIVSELLLPPADLMKFSISEPSTNNGSIPLLDGISLISSSKRALLASACQVIDPQKFHRRLHRSEAESFLSSCRLGQTEYGSFVVTLACPLDSGAEIPNVTNENNPFTRLVTTSLMRATQELINAIDADNLAVITNPADQNIIASANFCDALMEMQPNDTNGSLIISTQWSKKVPAPTGLVGTVSIRKDYFPQIEEASKSLRPNITTQEENFVAVVESLDGYPDEQRRVQGEITLLFLNSEDGQVVRARVQLGPEEYQVALAAHGSAGYVKLRGTLHRGARTNKILNHSDFAQIQGS